MKKTLIALLALSGIAMGASPITLFDQWTFDKDWTSKEGRSFTGSSTQITETYSGTVKIRLYNGQSGWKLEDRSTADDETGDNTLNIGNKNWAITLKLKLELGNNSSFRDKGIIFKTSMNNGLGIRTRLDSTSGAYSYDITNDDGYTAPFSSGSFTTYTVLNYNSAMYLAVNGTWYNVVLNNGTSRDYIAKGFNLDDITLGYNGTDYGLSPDTDVFMTLDDISVYTLDNTVSTLNEVKAALVPEPTTATLSLLALAGLAARRRRK